jgi:hypothetical protein
LGISVLEKPNNLSDRAMRLIVIIQDHLSGWDEKGEIVRGYFNPGNVFKKA